MHVVRCNYDLLVLCVCFARMRKYLVVCVLSSAHHVWHMEVNHTRRPEHTLRVCHASWYTEKNAHAAGAHIVRMTKSKNHTHTVNMCTSHRKADYVQTQANTRRYTHT